MENFIAQGNDSRHLAKPRLGLEIVPSPKIRKGIFQSKYLGANAISRFSVARHLITKFLVSQSLNLNFELSNCGSKLDLTLSPLLFFYPGSFLGRSIGCTKPFFLFFLAPSLFLLLCLKSGIVFRNLTWRHIAIFIKFRID